MVFEFEDKNLNPILEKVHGQERLSLEDGITLEKSRPPGCGLPG